MVPEAAPGSAQTDECDFGTVRIVEVRRDVNKSEFHKESWRRFSLMPGSGTLRLAQGLRLDTGHPPGSAVKSLSLTIHRLAQWSPFISGPLPRRAALSSRRKADPQSAGKADGPRHPASSITRDVFQARLTCPSHAIRGTKQTTYKNHSISTTQSRDGLWVAAFGRLNGEMMEIENTKRAVLETAAHEAETIAIADAQIQIDERDADAS